MSNATDSDAGIKRVLLCREGREPVPFSPRPRWFHAPIHLCHDVASVRIIVEANDPRARVRVGDLTPAVGAPSDPVPLACGRNAFAGSVTSVDGTAKTDFCFRIYRAFPHPAWERVTSSAPWPARDSAGELVFRDRMWLLGGYIPATTNDVWNSADGLAWTRGGDVPTTAGIDIPVAFVLNDRMWVADLNGHLFSSADGKTWALATDKSPCRGRTLAGCVVFNGRVWVMGGRRGGELLNDVWSSPDGVNWTQEAEHAPWCARHIHHTPLVLDGHLWLLGGCVQAADYYPFTAWNDLWRSPDGRRWERVLEHAPWPGRIWGSSAVYRDRLWLIGGFRSEPVWENLGDVWYSADGCDWRRLESVPTLRHSGAHNVPFVRDESIWGPRHEQSVYTHAGALWVVGGMIWPLMNDVWKIEIPGLCFVTQPVIETYAGGQYEYAARADFHRSRKPLRYRLARGPEWLTLDAGSGVLRGTAPRAGDAGVILEASDDTGETARQEFTLHALCCT
jgi:hypothetical protein